MSVVQNVSVIHTSFLTPKLLASMEAAERGSRRAAERGSAAAEIDRGSCKGSLMGGAEAVDFEPLAPCFPFFAEVVSTVCREARVSREVHSECETVTDRHNAHQRMVGNGVLTRETNTLQFDVVATHTRPPRGKGRSVRTTYFSYIFQAHQLRSSVAMTCCQLAWPTLFAEEHVTLDFNAKSVKVKIGGATTLFVRL